MRDIEKNKKFDTLNLEVLNFRGTLQNGWQFKEIGEVSP